MDAYKVQITLESFTFVASCTTGSFRFALSLKKTFNSTFLIQVVKMQAPLASHFLG
ncbi:hypothetical protein [Lactococcus lactis]|uniref:hypothetical protein n=1 Tax=Lactococcus lactis TaxID=1358 RepID=UPI0013A5A63B|nr:hypothetical protein [Lactococcus lactis]